MSSPAVTFEDNSASWLQTQKTILSRALRRMGQDAVSLAKMTAPKKTGASRASGHVEGLGLEILAVFGDSDVKYAYKQETTQFSHYTTPNTGPHFLENGGDTAVKKGIKAYL